MAIECYHDSCKFHSCHYDADSGPICDESECRATPDELKQFEEERTIWMREHVHKIEIPKD